MTFTLVVAYIRRSRWPQGRFAAILLQRLRVRIPPGTCMSLVNIVYCKVRVFATVQFLVQRSPTERGVYLNVISKPRQLGGLGPSGAVVFFKKKTHRCQKIEV
jgi:hypothetical protein